MDSGSDWSALGDLLDARIIETYELSSTVTKLHLSDGRSVVVKTLPRQSRDSWLPGQPWTELVTLDSLGYVGAPVPKLIAADLHNGWLVMQYINGHPIWQLTDTSAGFTDLAASLQKLEHTMAQEWDHLEDFATQQSAEHNSLLVAVRDMIPSEAKDAWDRLVDKAQLGDDPSDSNHTHILMTIGPLDVNGRNVIWCPKMSSFVFLDMAVIGYDFVERRLAAYAQTMTPMITSMLTEQSFVDYGVQYGMPSAYRLVCFDFVFWGIALARLHAVMTHPSDTSLSQAIEGWGDPQKAMDQVTRMWCRPRIQDDDVDAIRHSLPFVR